MCGKRDLSDQIGGLSHAKNLAVSKAGGEILAFTDADTILPEDWLLRIKEGFEKHDCAALSGRVLLLWETKPPVWLMKDINAGKGPFGLDSSEEMGYCTKGAPNGINNAVRKECFQKYGGFRTDLGPRTGFYFAGEDTEFFRRIIRSGEKVFYYPPMTVYHQIPRKRLEKRRVIRDNFLGSLCGLRAGMKTGSALETLTVLPETIFKLVVAGLCPGRFVTLSALRYRSRLYSLLYTLSYKLAGEKNAIRLARIFRLIDKKQKNTLLESAKNVQYPRFF